MAKNRCPGMDPAFFRFEDIQTHPCIECGRELEFWKDDARLVCSGCERVNFNPNLGNTCLAWCKEAARCIGNDDIREWMARHKNP